MPHMHLDHESCIEVTVLKGKGTDVQEFGDIASSPSAVYDGQIVYLPAEGVHNHAHVRGHTHSHGRRPGVEFMRIKAWIQILKR